MVNDGWIFKEFHSYSLIIRYCYFFFYLLLNFGVYSVDRSKEFMTLLVRSAFQKKKSSMVRTTWNSNPMFLTLSPKTSSELGGVFVSLAIKGNFSIAPVQCTGKKERKLKEMLLSWHWQSIRNPSCPRVAIRSSELLSGCLLVYLVLPWHTWMCFSPGVEGKLWQESLCKLPTPLG